MSLINLWPLGDGDGGGGGDGDPALWHRHQRGQLVRRVDKHLHVQVVKAERETPAPGYWVARVKFGYGDSKKSDLSNPCENRTRK